MMAMLVLMILILIASQIRISTITDARIARNQGTLSNMDLVIESAFLKVYEDLKADAAEDSGGGEGGGSAPGGLGGGGAPDAGGGGATDSSKDGWARPGRTEINELQLRFYFQDEDSKYNILSMLTEDEEEAEKARDRVARILDLCREGTDADIDGGDAESMADAMLAHMQQRSNSMLPRPTLLSDDEDNEDLGLPMSLREFVVLPEFHPSHFRDYRDEEGNVVHSIGSFLTLWTSLTTVDEASGGSGPANPSGGTPSGAGAAPSGSGGLGSGAGADEASQAGSSPLSDDGDSIPGGADNTPGDSAGATPSAADTDAAPKININRAPVAVLKSLMDDRDVSSNFWDALIEYRNEEDETETDDSEDPPVDEFGNEIVVRQIFNAVNDLAQLDGWENLEPIVQAELRALLTVKSDVFSVFITARRRTAESDDTEFFIDEQAVEEDEQLGLDLLRTVRCVLWRRTSGEEAEIIPLVRWEVLDYVPFEVLDYPGEER